jgi:hypothetical protein
MFFGPTAHAFAQPSPTGWVSEYPRAKQGQRPGSLRVGFIE